MRRVLVCVLFTACAAPAAAQPPISPLARASGAAILPSAPASAAPSAQPGARLAASDLPVAIEPHGPVLKVEVERPFRLDLRVVPKDREVFLAELHDRERWNKGDLGDLVGEPPPVPGHPQPRVIIDVTNVRGPHKAADVQREARRLFWIKVVGCYGKAAYKDQKLRGKTRAVVQVDKSGRVRGARIVETKLGEEDVPKCFAEELKKLPLPKARAGSAVTIEIQVSPGDEPMSPPPPLILPGDGTIDPEAVREVVRAALPSFEACYRPALAYAPKLWGRLGVRFHQTEKGKLDEAFEVESRFPDERVSLCVLRAARALAFPKPTGGEVRFVVPLRFSTDAAP